MDLSDLVKSIDFRLLGHIVPDLYLNRVDVPVEIYRTLYHGKLVTLTPHQYITVLRTEFNKRTPSKKELFYLFEFVKRTSHFARLEENVRKIIWNDEVVKRYKEWLWDMGKIKIEFDGDRLTEERVVTLASFTRPDLRWGSNEPSLKLLAFDGGGMKGLFMLSMLKAIVTRKYGDSGSTGTKQFVENFDLIAGTSTGAIIAVGLSSGLSIDTLITEYQQLGEKVFDGRMRSYYRYLRKGYWYDHTVLADELRKMFPKEQRMITMTKPLLLVATDNSNSEFEPFLFRTYTSPSRIMGSNTAKLITALRGSTAAPTYFEPVKEEDPENGERITVIDGGVVANNPMELTLFESFHLWPTKSIQLALSFGTGRSIVGGGYSNLFGFGKELLNLVTNSAVVHNRITEWLEREQIDINYLRFDPPDLGSIALDCTDKTILADGMNKAKLYLNNNPELINLLHLLK